MHLRKVKKKNIICIYVNTASGYLLHLKKLIRSQQNSHLPIPISYITDYCNIYY